MSIKFVKAAAFAMVGTIAMTAGQALAQDEKPRSLDQLLEFVKQGQVTEARQNRAREQAFATDKANQAAELKRAEAERASQEQLSAELEDAFFPQTEWILDTIHQRVMPLPDHQTTTDHGLGAIVHRNRLGV